MPSHAPLNNHFVVTAYATLWTVVCALLPLCLAGRLRQRRSVGLGYFAWGAIIAALAVSLPRILVHTSYPFRPRKPTINVREVALAQRNGG